MRVVVGPGLVADSVLEVVCSSSDSQVNDEVKFSIERSVIGFSDPWVIVGRTEVSLLEEALRLHVDVQDDVGLRIEIGVESIFVPIETIDVEIIVKTARVFVFLVCHLEFVGCVVKTPVESRSESVDTAVRVRFVVTSRLHNVDFTRGRPLTVLVVFGEHPNCRPEPVSSWKLGAHLNSPVFEGETVHGS